MKKPLSAEELISTIQKVKKEAVEAKPVVDNIGSNIQHVIDFCDVTLPLIPFLPNGSIEELGVIWNEINQQTRQTYPWLYQSISDSDATAGTVSLSASSISMIIERNYGPISFVENSNPFFDDFYQVTNKAELYDKVVELLKDFHLDSSSSGMQGALDLFIIAHHAYENPIPESDPAITSLIPMRESVSRVIADLLRMRPKQEETGKSDKNKIISIAIQLKKDIITDVLIQEWAEQWHQISDEDLSSSKQNKISRNEWRQKLNRATLFLHGFLSGLDKEKLRK